MVSLQLRLLSCCIHVLGWDHIKVDLFTFRSSALLLGLMNNGPVSRGRSWFIQHHLSARTCRTDVKSTASAEIQGQMF